MTSLRKLAAAASGLGLALCLAGSANAQIAFIDGGGNFNYPVTTFRDIPFRSVVRQEYDFSCGSAALATLLNYHYDQPITEADVFKAMYAVGDKEQIRKVGFSLLDMKRYLETRGMVANGFRASLDQLENARAPAIAVVVIGQYRHFVVIKGVRNGNVLIGDPAQGLKTYTEAEFAKMWNGIIFAVVPRPNQKAKYNRPEEWSVWPRASMDDEQLAATSVYGPAHELPPVYQVSGFREVDPFGTAAANAAAGQ